MKLAKEIWLLIYGILAGISITSVVYNYLDMAIFAWIGIGILYITDKEKKHE